MEVYCRGETNDFVVSVPNIPETSQEDEIIDYCSSVASFKNGNKWKINIVVHNGNYKVILTYVGYWPVIAKVRMEFIFFHKMGPLPTKGSKWDAVYPTEFMKWTPNQSNPLLAVDKMSLAGSVRNMTSVHWNAKMSVSINVFIDIDSELSQPSFIKTMTESVTGYIQTHGAELSDVIIIGADGSRIPAYKLFLAAQSDVLRAMLTTSMTESTTNEIVISDFEPAVVAVFISHLTADDIDQMIQHNTEVNFCELFKIAHKYNVSRLILAYEHAVLQSICEDNVVELLIFADTYELECLKQSAKMFISTHFDFLSVAPLLESLPVTLSHEIMQFMGLV